MWFATMGKKLNKAAEKGDNVNVRELLKKATAKELNWQNEIGETALTKASFAGYTDIVEMLLGNPDIEVNLSNHEGNTAIMQASRGGHAKVVDALLLHPHTQILVRNMEGKSASDVAANEEIVALFFKANGERLLSAAENGETDMVRILLNAKISAIEVNWESKSEATALILACRGGHIKVVEILLTHANIDVNLQDKCGNTALMEAAREGHISIVELLLAHPNVDVNLQDEYGNNALTAKRSFPEIVKKLLAHPAIDINHQSRVGYTALMKASDYGHVEIVEALLAHPSIDVTLLDMIGDAALAFAVAKGHSKIVKILLDHPLTEVNLQNMHGVTSLAFASNKGILEIVKMLLTHSEIEVNIQDKEKETALVYASEKGHTKIVKILLTCPRIDVNLQNVKGITALMRASRKGHAAIVEMFLSHPTLEINMRSADGITAFMAASHSGHAETVKMLLTHSDIDINTTCQIGYTAVMYAVSEGHVAVVELLLNQKSIDIKIQDKNGKTASELAKNEKIKALLQAHADANTWLAVRLLPLGVDVKLVKDCEQKLALDDITSEDNFAELPPSEVDAAYLKGMGISAKGVQQKIIKLHRELYELKLLSPTSTAKPVGAVELTFACGTIPIEDVQPLVADDSSLHGATSSRLLLRGHFSQTIVDFSGNKTTKFSCVIKCADDSATAAANSDGAMAIRRECSMYESIKEIARLKGSTSTGCIACYHMHRSARYLVLEAYGQDIRSLLLPNFNLAPHLAEAIIAAVASLHALGVMHGDIKPHNILFDFDHLHRCVVKLCDLDCSYKVGEVCAATALGTKLYEAPEVYFASRANESVTVALSMDMFSLGLVLWQVLTRSPYPPLHSENTQDCYLNQDQLNVQLALPEQSAIYTPLLRSITALNLSERITADALYKKVRVIAASKAQQNLHKEKEANVFLKEVISNKLDGLQEELQLLRQGQELLGVQVGRVLRDNKRLDTMMRTLIAGSHDIPTYAIILPVVATSWLRKSDPMRLVHDQYRLYFLCSHTHQLAPCGPKGEGYKISVTKQWVRDAAPVLMAALIVLKLALMAGGLPLPIPDLSPLLDTPALHVKFLDAALHLVKTPTEDLVNKAEFIMDKAIDALDSVAAEELLNEQDKGGLSLEEGSLKAYATIQSILKTDNIDIVLTSGLRQVVHPVTGKTAWVLDNDRVAQDYCESKLTDESDSGNRPQSTLPASQQQATSAECTCMIS